MIDDLHVIIRNLDILWKMKRFSLYPRSAVIERRKFVVYDLFQYELIKIFKASISIAISFADNEIISHREAILRINPADMKLLNMSVVDPLFCEFLSS